VLLACARDSCSDWQKAFRRRRWMSCCAACAGCLCGWWCALWVTGWLPELLVLDDAQRPAGSNRWTKSWLPTKQTSGDEVGWPKNRILRAATHCRKMKHNGSHWVTGQASAYVEVLVGNQAGVSEDAA